jgi:hypothetical protein
MGIGLLFALDMSLVTGILIAYASLFARQLATSTRSAAEASMPGKTWLPRSHVIPILEYPSTSAYSGRGSTFANRITVIVLSPTIAKRSGSIQHLALRAFIMESTPIAVTIPAKLGCFKPAALRTAATRAAYRGRWHSLPRTDPER